MVSIVPCFQAKRRQGAILAGIEDIHITRLGYMIFDKRVNSIRDDTELRRLNINSQVGMRFSTLKEADPVPNVRLSAFLRKNQASDARFFQRNAAFPDHMFAGLIKAVLFVSFASLPSNNVRRRVELQILNVAAFNCLPAERNLIRWSSDYFQGLLSMTMPTIFLCFIVHLTCSLYVRCL